jgi:DNA-binding CsgD family transcriptional regulator
MVLFLLMDMIDLEVGDELRASFVIDGTCWGIASFLREEDRIFDPNETAFLRELAPHVADGLRRTILSSFPGDKVEAPGTMVLNAHGRIEMITPEAQAWLEELQLHPEGDAYAPPLPVIIMAAAAHARRVASGEVSSSLYLRARTRTGQWVTLHASSLYDDGHPTGRVAVMIAPSRSNELMAVLVEAFAFTPREREVLELLIRGYTTKRIARQLGLSVHTVRDYVKIILDKVNVRSRSELVARIFWQHVHDKLAEKVQHTGVVP